MFWDGPRVLGSHWSMQPSCWNEAYVGPIYDLNNVFFSILQMHDKYTRRRTNKKHVEPLVYCELCSESEVFLA